MKNIKNILLIPLLTIAFTANSHNNSAAVNNGNPGIFGEEISNDPLENEFLVYPNPVTDYLWVKANREIYQLEIYNKIGDLIVSLDHIDNDAQIDLRNLRKGTYWLNIQSPAGRYSKRIMVK